MSVAQPEPPRVIGEPQPYRFSPEQRAKMAEAGLFASDAGGGARRFSVHDYHLLYDLEILGPDERVELIAGQLVRMSPIGARHARVVSRLTKYFILNARSRYEVDTQNAAELFQDWEPHPDVVLFDPAVQDLARLVRPRDIYLLVEVADSTLYFDRQRKLEGYAISEIPEVWILNLRDNLCEIYRAPRR